jgi:hypothetical protein
MRAGDGLGDGGQRAIDLAFEFEAMAEDFDLQDLALVGAVEDGAGRRQTTIVLGGRLGSPGRGNQAEGPGLGRRQAEVSVVGEFAGALARTPGEVAFGAGLQAPGDAFDEPGLVAGTGSFAEESGNSGRVIGLR